MCNIISNIYSISLSWTFSQRKEYFFTNKLDRLISRLDLNLLISYAKSWLLLILYIGSIFGFIDLVCGISLWRWSCTLDWSWLVDLVCWINFWLVDLVCWISLWYVDLLNVYTYFAWGVHCVNVLEIEVLEESLLRSRDFVPQEVLA